MLTHDQIWTALDLLAKKRGMSSSGLAKRAGLDPTTFNRSKRESANGKLRWPSTESIAKVLTATDASLDEFVSLVSKAGAHKVPARLIPLIGFAQAGSDGYFDDAGFPAGAGWEEIAFPDVGDPHAYALEVTGESMTPVYRDGDRIIVSPDASTRRGDRVVVRTTSGEVMAKELSRLTAKRVELTSFHPDYPERSLDLAEVQFMHRIIWASQ
jgi:phage repressor protein C with HTH and peptisase S24 domain